jgi:hypothetical protein
MRPSQVLDIALVTYGNMCTALTDSSFKLAIPDKHLFNDISNITFVRKVDRLSNSGRIVFSGIPKWFDYLSERRATRLWYVDPVNPDYSRNESIQVDFGSAHELWGGYADWLEKDKGLTCRYEGYPSPYSRVKDIDLRTAKEDLKAALRRAMIFSKDGLGDGGNEKRFRKALSILDLDESEVVTHLMGAVPEEGYSLTTYQVFAGVFEGWCWWGMSDFSDVKPEDRSRWAEHDQIDADLYAAMQNGLMAAANSRELRMDKIQKHRGERLVWPMESTEFVPVKDGPSPILSKAERKKIRKEARPR